MIKDRKALGLYEVEELLADAKDNEKVQQTKAYIKKYLEIKPEKAKKLREALNQLDIMKLKETDIIKIVDLLPENALELNKIIVETSLDTDEVNKILDTIKGNK